MGLLLDLLSLDSGGTVYQYQATGGVVFSGVATTVFAPVSIYAYHPNAVVLTRVASDLTLGSDITGAAIEDEDLNSSDLVVTQGFQHPEDRIEYWYTPLGFPGLVSWGVFSFVLKTYGKITGFGPSAFVTVARVNAAGTVIQESAEQALTWNGISSLNTKTFAFAPIAGSTTDRFRVKYRFNFSGGSPIPVFTITRLGQFNKAAGPTGGSSIALVPFYPMRFGGAGTEKFAAAWAASGGITFGGAATEKIIRAYAASGGITFGGQDVEKFIRKYIASGGILFGGHAAEKFTEKYAAAGGIVFGGAATTVFAPATAHVYSYTGTGGIVFSGHAQTSGPKSVADRSGDYFFKPRRPALVTLSSIGYAAITETAPVSVEAAAASSVEGVEAYCTLGRITIDASSAVRVSSLESAGSTSGQLRIVSGASVLLDSVLAQTELGDVTASTSAIARVPGVTVRVTVGRPSIEIGPDLVAQEFEELLLLMELELI